MNQPIDSFQYLHWGPCVTKFILEDSFIENLLNKGKKLKENNRKRLAANTEKSYRYTETDIEWFMSYFEFYLKNHLMFLDQYHNKKHNFNLKLNTLWINIMNAGEFNPPHSHESVISFVIYLQVPKELEEEKNEYLLNSSCKSKDRERFVPAGIKFINSVGSDDMVISEHNIFPQKNECYIFPANLTHMVFPFQSDCERISVSGNFINKG